MQKRLRHERITRINSKVGRDINRSIVLNTVRRHQPISRASLSELTRLNKSTVSSIVASLIEEDLLLEAPDKGGGIGRNPVNLSVKHGTHFVGAISLDAPRTSVALVDIDGSVVSRQELDATHLRPEPLVIACANEIERQRRAAGRHTFHGIGATVGGIVDSVRARVVYASNLEWSDVDLAGLFRERLNDVDTVLVETDAKASALAELLLGRNRFVSNDILFVSLGSGIGVGFAVHGRILEGHSHAAGEVGHMTVSESGELCSCGNTGCWEITASERAPIRAYEQTTGSRLDPSDPIRTLSARALGGDGAAVSTLATWARHVGVGIGNLISMFDPEVVVIGGSITTAWDQVGETVIAAARGKGKYSHQRTTRIIPTSLHESPPLMGAAALNIRRIFHDFSLMQ